MRFESHIQRSRLHFCGWLLAVLLGAPASATAQNLVLNGSFEDIAWCPSQFNQKDLRTIEHWTQAGQGTPDHFHECSNEVGVPINTFGRQPAVDGIGYAGVVLFSQPKPRYREYLQTRLTRSLSRGEWACVSWWVSAADAAQLVTDGMGAHFSVKPVVQDREDILSVTPQVANPPYHILSDRHSWIRLSDVFRAEGGERYLTLGNFRAPRGSRVMERLDAPTGGSRWAYVYVDDVAVRPVKDPAECSCLNTTYLDEATNPPWQTFMVERQGLSSVLFAFDQDELDAKARAQLDAVAEQMRRDRFLVLEVNGHTDIVGPDGYNLALSERRAQGVMAYLKERGVDPNRLVLAYHGSSLPSADNRTPDGRRQNRRVAFELLEHAFLPLR